MNDHSLLLLLFTICVVEFGNDSMNIIFMHYVINNLTAIRVILLINCNLVWFVDTWRETNEKMFLKNKHHLPQPLPLQNQKSSFVLEPILNFRNSSTRWKRPFTEKHSHLSSNRYRWDRVHKCVSTRMWSSWKIWPVWMINAWICRRVIHQIMFTVNVGHNSLLMYLNSIL